MDKSDTIIVSCATLRQELEFIMEKTGCTFDIEWIDSGLHIWPNKLRTRVQEVLDGISPAYKTVLLMFGFCGNSMVGIKSNDKTLVLPLVADCIPIFLGSQEEHEKRGHYTYFFTGGYLNSERTFITEFQDMKTRYGETRAKKYTKQMLAHYKLLSVIDTGAYELKPVLDEVHTFAGEMELPVDVVPGNLRIIANLLSGDWDEHSFLIVPPGGEVTFNDSLRSGKSQSSV